MANEPADRGASNESAASRRPFLNDEADSARGDNTVSILAALSSTMQMPAVQIPPDRTSRRKTWLVAGGVALVIAALGFGYATSQRPADDVPAAVTASADARAAPVASPIAAAAVVSPGSSAEAMSPVPPASEPAVARVEDLPVTPSTAALPAAEAVKPAERSAASAPLATPKAPSKSATRLAAAEAARRKEKRDAAATRHVVAEKASRDVKLAMVEKRSAPSTAHEAAPVASSQADSDVDLMAALLDHMAKGKTADGSNDAFARGASTAAARPMTISGLVDSCRSAGSKSAVTECRRQICKGYWGKAQACPAHLAPGATARRKADQ